MSTLKADVPRALAPLLQPARYKGAHGGRGGGKSHFFAEEVICRCIEQKSRIVCIREVQNTIKESVKQLLMDKISKLGVEHLFDPIDTEIRGPNDSLIIFKGMQSYNAENIKSLEGYDVAWVEEAQTLSDRSLRMLRPTIRKDGSEIWFSWNPRHDTDAVDAFLRGPNKPSDAVVVEINWHQNPWFPEVLKAEKDADYRTDPEMAEHVWGGGYELVSEGAYYAKLLAHAERESRIGSFPWDGRQRIRTAWDLGVEDYTAVWLIADDGFTPTVLDYYEASGEGYDDIISVILPELFIPPPHDDRFKNWSAEHALKLLGRDKPFRYASHFLPHDVAHRIQGFGARHRNQIFEQCGVKPLHKGVPANPEDRVAASRALLPLVRFNNTPRVAKGIARLRRYSRKMNDQLGTYTGPLHDINSHGADAFGEWAINCGIEPPKVKPAPVKVANLDVSIGPGVAAPADAEALKKLSPKQFIAAIKKQREGGRRANG